MSTPDRSDGALVPVPVPSTATEVHARQDVDGPASPATPTVRPRAGWPDFRLHPETRRWLFYVGVAAPVVLAVASAVQELVLAVAR